MKTRIHFQPASQVENTGDRLINLATIRAIGRYGEIVVNDLGTPSWFIDAIGAGGERRFSEYSRRRYYVSLARQLIRSWGAERTREFLLLAPGHTARRGWREAGSAFAWYARLVILRLLGCKVVRAGFSIGPFDALNAWVESFGSRAFHYYGVRDRASLSLARRYRFARPRYFPDLAWSHRPGAVFLPAPDGPVVLSFRSNAYGTVHEPGYLRPIRERLLGLLALPALAGRRIVVAHQVASDRAASLALHDALLAAGRTTELREGTLAIEEAERLYAAAGCVISNRLHVLMLAAQAGTLPVALAHGSDNVKITSILEDNGLAGIVLDLGEDDEASRARLDAMLRARATILERIRSVREENARRIEHGFAAIFRPGDGRERHGPAAHEASL